MRIGYLMLAVAVVAFFAAVALGFPRLAVAASIAGLVGSCVFLPPAIIAGYAVKAAEREDRRAGRPPGPPGGSARGDTMP
jgi:hypothetical protein